MSTNTNFGQISHHTADVNGVSLHYVICGTGDPVVLLHGWPTTWYEWRQVIPLLTENYTAIAIDTRGLGDSSRPKTGYDKRTLAEDIYGLVKKLGFNRINLVGHDLGGQIAYAYANEYPDNVRRLAIVDVPLPGLTDWDKLKSKLWHFAFHEIPNLPETLVKGRERSYISYFYSDSFTEAEIDEYVRTYSAPDAMKAGFEYYRAFDRDAKQNHEYAKTKLKMPVMAIAGANSLGNALYQQLQPITEDLKGEVITNGGHWLSVEHPEKLARLLLSFLSQNSNN